MDCLRDDRHAGQVYIYALVDPREGEIRYVGKSQNPHHRLCEHYRHSNAKYNPHKYAWLIGLRTIGLAPETKILETVQFGAWQDREKFWIAHLKECGARLLNITDGGDGGSTFKGRKHTEASKIKSRLAHLGQRTWLGRKHSQKSKDKIGLAHTGRSLSESHKASIAASMLGCQNSLGVRPSAETRLKLSLIHKGMKHKPETIRKMIASNSLRRQPQRDFFFSWLISRPRIPKTQRALAKHLGISEATLSAWKRKWHQDLHPLMP